MNGEAGPTLRTVENPTGVRRLQVLGCRHQSLLDVEYDSELELLNSSSYVFADLKQYGRDATQADMFSMDHWMIKKRHCFILAFHELTNSDDEESDWEDEGMMPFGT